MGNKSLKTNKPNSVLYKIYSSIWAMKLWNWPICHPYKVCLECSDKLNVQMMPMLNPWPRFIFRHRMVWCSVEMQQRIYMRKIKIWYGTWKTIIHYWGHFFCMFTQYIYILAHGFEWIVCCRECILYKLYTICNNTKIIISCKINESHIYNRGQCIV